jgi:hypothetical protein
MDTTIQGNPHNEGWNGCIKRPVEHLASRSAPA